MLPRQERLTQRRDFVAVYAQKKSWANPLLVLYVRRHSPTGENAETRRFGFSVSKKVGKAHDRNRVKRRLREICRLNRGGWRTGFDAIWVVRTAAQTATYSELETAVLELMRRAGLWLRERKPSQPSPESETVKSGETSSHRFVPSVPEAGRGKEVVTDHPPSGSFLTESERSESNAPESGENGKNNAAVDDQ